MATGLVTRSILDGMISVRVDAAVDADGVPTDSPADAVAGVLTFRYSDGREVTMTVEGGTLRDTVTG